MNKKIFGKKSAYLGAALIAVGILFNKRLIEVILISDGRIEATAYVASIYIFQLLAIAVGAWLLIKQPAVRMPRATEVILTVFSILLTFFLLEAWHDYG